MTTPRWTVCVASASIVLSATLLAQRPGRMMADALFDAYRAQRPRVVSDALSSMTTGQRFEQFRADFESRVLPEWQRGPRTRLQAAFMLEIAVATDGRRHSYQGWESFLTLGSTFLSNRPEPPGANPDADAFEVLWHQTTVAFLDTLQDPFVRERAGVKPMEMASGWFHSQFLSAVHTSWAVYWHSAVMQLPPTHLHSGFMPQLFWSSTVSHGRVTQPSPVDVHMHVTTALHAGSSSSAAQPVLSWQTLWVADQMQFWWFASVHTSCATPAHGLVTQVGGRMSAFH